MIAGVFVFADHMSPRPARFNSRFNLLDQSSFLSWPIWSVNAIPESLFWCSGSQNFSQHLMALHFVFVRIGKRPTFDPWDIYLERRPVPVARALTSFLHVAVACKIYSPFINLLKFSWKRVIRLIYKVGLELRRSQNRWKTTRIRKPRLIKAKPSETKL